MLVALLQERRALHIITPIEAAKMAPRYNPTPALLYDREKRRGNANRSTLAVVSRPARPRH